MDISVVVTTHNRAALLPETLDAILAQTHSAGEVIVVNDGSTDETMCILAGYADRIIAIHQANAGVQAARNAGIARASGAYIALSDDDDIWDPRYLQAQAELLAVEPGIDLSFGNFRNFRGTEVDAKTKFDKAPPGWWQTVPHRVLSQGWVFEASIAGATFIFHPIFPSATVVSKALWQRVGGYNPGIGHIGGEDGEFTLRCLYNTKVAALPEPLVLIRRHAGNFSADLVQRLQGEIYCQRHILASHPEAAQYREVIEREIRIKQVQILDAAFASFDHAQTRRAFHDLVMADRTAKIWAKRIVAGMPEIIARPLNVLLQRAASGKAHADGPATR